MEMENVTTGEEYGGNGVERLCEADHAHVVRVLLQYQGLVTALETGQTVSLPGNPSTGVAAGEGGGAG